jgi:4-amino-4-deoxy-L-arabinose transferase-like glycosyltransferase
MSRSILIVIILAIIIRFAGLSVLPPALNRDEAAIGWNAYSLLKTGKDEHGIKWPLNFKSIGDYKMPGYIYATILPIKVFGLNEFSIRFWSALAGVVSVLMVYLISKNILAGLLMVLNPWAIFYSRIAFEANLALALFLTGLWLVLNKRFWGLIFWILAMLTYSSSLIFIPLFSFVLIKKIPKFTYLWFIIVAVLTIKLMSPVSSQKANITIFSDPTTINFYNQTRTAIFQQNPLLARTWWNKYVFWGRLAAMNYLKTFSPKFLLTQGGNHPWHQIPKMGYFYPAEIILALVGLWRLKQKKQWLLSWLLLAPLASAITIDAPHATRSLFLLPAVVIIASFGLPKAKWLKIGLIALYLINLNYFSYQYLVNYPKRTAAILPVDLKTNLLRISDRSQPLVLTGIYDSVYLYPLVYLQVDPREFQSTAKWTSPDTAGLSNAYSFSNITIRD